MWSHIEHILFPLEAFNYGAQLVAIRGLLYRQERADEELSDRIKEADEVARRTKGPANDHAVDAYAELAEMSCYQDAAHSMAAVGMIAPLIESAFRAAFPSIGTGLPRRNLAKDIVKHVEEVGMKEYLPADLEPTLAALFKYRNEMFHGGFEWSSEKLKKFETLLGEERWPSGWFSKATSDDDPWMFYMTPAFVDHCLDVAERVIRGIEQFGLEKNFGPLSPGCP
ncbi:MAG: hypothetical protein OXE02_10725 [Chloroflexi bacterium]|nr:hypothetical protein [Chloroflexota bacterium]